MYAHVHIYIYIYIQLIYIYNDIICILVVVVSEKEILQLYCNDIWMHIVATSHLFAAI